MFASMYICAPGVCKAQEGHRICLELELQMLELPLSGTQVLSKYF